MKKMLGRTVLVSAAITVLTGCAQVRDFFDPSDATPLSSGASAPTLGGVKDLYTSWAGEDGVLTVAEWDTAVDRHFGEDDINLAVARWDVDGNGVISPVEFQAAVARDDRFDPLLR